MTNSKWKPRASNITGLVGVRRRQGNEKTFINHAISRWEKRQINREVAAEEKKKKKEVVVPTPAVVPAVVINATAKVQKKRGRPTMTAEQKAAAKAKRNTMKKSNKNKK